MSFGETETSMSLPSSGESGALFLKGVRCRGMRSKGTSRRVGAAKRVSWTVAYAGDRRAMTLPR